VCVCVCVCVCAFLADGCFILRMYVARKKQGNIHIYLTILSYPTLHIYHPIYLYKHTSTDAKQCVADIQVMSNSTLTNVFFPLLCTLHSILNCSSCLVLSPITGIHPDAVKFTTAHSLIRFNNTLP
jgi:hypothetical protein